MWHAEHRIESNAAPETLWKLFADVANWKRWNAGVEHSEIHGEFAAGTEFTMKVPGQEEAIVSKLTVVRPNELFTDETVLGDIRVVVEHRIERVTAGRTLVRYRIEVAGPNAAEVGTAVSADFPDVLKSLAAIAENRQSV
jgi:hypothetical protein